MQSSIPNLSEIRADLLAEIPGENDENKSEKLETFNGIRKGQLKQVFTLEFLENGRLNFHELI